MRRACYGAFLKMSSKDPKPHRTIDRVTQLLEEVVYHPGITFSELVAALGAAKSSVHGFIGGLQARGWLHEDRGHYYLGPALHGLTLATGHIRAGVVTYPDLVELHEMTGSAVFLGVRVGDHLIYIAEAGSDPATGFEARANIRRELIDTAGGKALLIEMPEQERDAYLRRQNDLRPEKVTEFLDEFIKIRETGLAMNLRRQGTRFAVATVVRTRAGAAVATLTCVGRAEDLQPRAETVGKQLLDRVQQMQGRTDTAREAI